MNENRTPAKITSADLTPDMAAADFQTFAMEYDEDRRGMRWAIVSAVILHIIFFLVQLPELVAEEREQRKQKVYVVQQVRFKPPPPKQQQEIPKPRSKKVPIPDPTPDEPEPIRLEEEIEPEVDLPDTDLVFGIPEGPPPTEPTGPIRVGGDVKPPKKIFHPSPQYTEIARKARITGVVIVEAIIDKQGNVTNVKILKGLPMGLDQAAVDAVKRWRFEPATLNGKPVAVIYNLTVNFQLQ
jgi:TonB family protein